MKQNAYGVAHSILAALALALAFVSGCATVPTPEELARREQARLEQKAGAHAQADAPRGKAEGLQQQEDERILRARERESGVLARREEVRSNAPGVRPSSQDVVLAGHRLSDLEAAAGKSLQTGSNPLYSTSNIKANSSPFMFKKCSLWRTL